MDIGMEYETLVISTSDSVLGVLRFWHNSNPSNIVISYLAVQSGN